MKILIVPDKFKGSLKAHEVCAAVEAGLAETGKPFESISIPLADGGEGTCDVLTRYSHGSVREVEVVDPLFRKILSCYGVSSDKKKAFVEMAAASGLQLLKTEERNPATTSTYGTGLMIRDAISNSVEEIVLGIGGSATNDGGIGMAAALGYAFLDATGSVLRPVGENLSRIKFIKKPPERIRPRVTILCDVRNPLYGKNGAAFVFAMQKGADELTVRLLDDGLRHFSGIVKSHFGVDLNFPGAGAGGGIAAGAHFFLNGVIRSGIGYVMDYVSLEHKVRESDLVITGEGKLDSQSLSGKVIQGVSELCSRHKKPLFIVTGKNELSVSRQRRLGEVCVISLVSDSVSGERAMAEAFPLIREAVRTEFSKII